MHMKSVGTLNCYERVTLSLTMVPPVPVAFLCEAYISANSKHYLHPPLGNPVANFQKLVKPWLPENMFWSKFSAPGQTQMIKSPGGWGNFPTIITLQH